MLARKAELVINLELVINPSQPEMTTCASRTTDLSVEDGREGLSIIRPTPSSVLTSPPADLTAHVSQSSQLIGGSENTPKLRENLRESPQ